METKTDIVATEEATETSLLPEAVKAVVNGADSDDTYDSLFPPHVRPGGFAHRQQNGALMPNETGNTFMECYPTYVTRHEFRELVNMERSKQAKAEAAQNQPKPEPAVEEVPAEETPVEPEAVEPEPQAAIEADPEPEVEEVPTEEPAAVVEADPETSTELL